MQASQNGTKTVIEKW